MTAAASCPLSHEMIDDCPSRRISLILRLEMRGVRGQSGFKLKLRQSGFTYGVEKIQQSTLYCKIDNADDSIGPSNMSDWGAFTVNSNQ